MVVAYHCQITNAVQLRPEIISKGRISRSANDVPAAACSRAVTTSRHAPSNRKAPRKSILLSVPGAKPCQHGIVAPDADGSVCNRLGMIITSRIKAADPMGTLDPGPLLAMVRMQVY